MSLVNISHFFFFFASAYLLCLTDTCILLYSPVGKASVFLLLLLQFFSFFDTKSRRSRCRFSLLCERLFRRSITSTIPSSSPVLLAFVSPLLSRKISESQTCRERVWLCKRCPTMIVPFFLFLSYVFFVYIYWQRLASQPDVVFGLDCCQSDGQWCWPVPRPTTNNSLSSIYI